MPIAKNNGAVAETPKTDVAQTAPAPVSRKLDTGTTPEEQKSRRILRQGVYQAVVQSAGLAGLPYTNADEYVALVEKVAERLIILVQK